MCVHGLESDAVANDWTRLAESKAKIDNVRPERDSSPKNLKSLIIYSPSCHILYTHTHTHTSYWILCKLIISELRDNFSWKKVFALFF